MKRNNNILVKINRIFYLKLIAIYRDRIHNTDSLTDYSSNETFLFDDTSGNKV